MREFRITRAFVVLLCIALVLWCSAMGQSAAHIDLAIPALVFCFLAVRKESRLAVSDGSPALQPIAFLSVHISRAPPLA